MTVRFEHQYFTFNKVQEVHEDMASPSKSYIKFSLSSSRKKKDNTREYSDWFAIAYGELVEVVKRLQKKDFVYCNGIFSRVPYTSGDGTIKWPNPTMVIFEIDKFVSKENEDPSEQTNDGYY